MSALPPPPPPSGDPAPSARRGTNGLAIAALVVSLTCCGPVGAILGFVSLGQIKRSGEQGRGMAIAGIVVGILSTLAALLWFVIAFFAGVAEIDYFAALGAVPVVPVGN